MRVLPPLMACLRTVSLLGRRLSGGYLEDSWSFGPTVCWGRLSCRPMVEVLPIRAVSLSGRLLGTRRMVPTGCGFLIVHVAVTPRISLDFKDFVLFRAEGRNQPLSRGITRSHTPRKSALGADVFQLLFLPFLYYVFLLQDFFRIPSVD